MNINKFTKDIYTRLLKEPAELNKRTGVGVKSLPGITFRTDLDIDGLPLLGLRKVPLNFVPEIMWFLSGQNDPTWLSKHTKIWDSFIDDDGKISSAYGYRWRHHFNVDQLNTVLTKLHVDNSNRHGVIMMWSPREDLLIKQKNVPCPVMFTLNIIGGRLHLHLMIRSNDMVLGFPTDVAGFAFLQYILAAHLNVTPGVLTVSISNCHIYENQIEAVEEMLKRDEKQILKIFPGSFPRDIYTRACTLDEELVAMLKSGLENYTPYPAIKNIPIAL